jgi:DNA-binding protein HU-beta
MQKQDAQGPMIKRHIVKSMKQRTGCSEDLCRAMLDAFVAIVLDGCRSHGTVKINGFGVFSRKDKPVRTARDPRNGRKIDVPAKSVLRFSSTCQM